jgi:hypothetical protein
MQKLIQDFLNEGFSRKEIVKYGVVYPTVLILVLIAVSAL